MPHEQKTLTDTIGECRGRGGGGRERSTRMIIVSIMFSLGSFAASQSTKYIVKVVSSIILLVIVEGVLFVTVIGAAVTLNNTRPKNKKRAVQEAEALEGDQDVVESDNVPGLFPIQ
ncbi:hypothetical protein ANCCAN_23924 [Ancylostoma caninum]|uniref:Uncharacterized protein n=1 Tax=Ancylostoma caninum TaxID=29170 RepID=A0A368FDQ0_ANCCA|nr:hypothetical protein ANCCAN_23924 [Ancylostoma caninum]